ncbi:uncharacterized protein [Littorina saxatilis]|uniref:Uncharacterized protein n=1 Tax=Littorina saxatilis TaxID=31220 RepID=A0AAN9BMQ7_9CAEN
MIYECVCNIRAPLLTVNASTRAILYDVLEQGKHIGQELLIKSKTRLLLPYSAECSRTVNMFHTCEGVEEKSRAIRICAKIVTSPRLVQCLRKDVLETFIACLDAVCNDGSSCIILRGNLNYISYVDPVKCRVPKGVLESGICQF